jgi:hypothetical protein
LFFEAPSARELDAVNAPYAPVRQGEEAKWGRARVAALLIELVSYFGCATASIVSSRGIDLKLWQQGPVTILILMTNIELLVGQFWICFFHKLNPPQPALKEGSNHRTAGVGVIQIARKWE